MNVPLRMLIVMLAMSVPALLPGRPALAQVAPGTGPTFWVYPAPSGVIPSPLYTVTIGQSGQPQNSPVYVTQNPAAPSIASSLSLEQTTAWTSFSLTAPVTVQVTNNNAKPFKSVRILPSSAQIVPTIVSANAISFVMTGPRQVSVEFCYEATASVCSDATEVATDIANPLLVFANPLTTSPFDYPPFAPLPPIPLANMVIAQPGSAGPPPPLGSGPGVIYFGPGVYELGSTPYDLGPDQTARLAGGAYVKGMFLSSGGSTIEGPGILSGESIPQSSCLSAGTCPMMIASTAGKVTIKGITIVNAPYYNIRLAGDRNTVENIKVMSWLPNTDGISASDDGKVGSSIRNSFFKTGDDAIKLYSSNLTVSGCTLWQLANAAAFEMGVNLSVDVRNVVVENSDVIRAEWTYPNRSNAVVSAAFGGKANGYNYVFNNIRVENPILQLFKLAVIPNPYAKSPNDTLGNITGVTFSNIQVSENPTLLNLFQSFNSSYGVSDVLFDNVMVAGQPLPQPTPTFNANRNFSLGGTVFSSVLARDTSQPANFQVGLFSGASGNQPYATPMAINAALPGGASVLRTGDFDGDGTGSVLFQAAGSAGTGVGLWHAPLQGSNYLVSSKADPPVAGIGDFNGDGRSDIVLWNMQAQTGTIQLMKGPNVIGAIPVQAPTTATSWTVAGIGDIDQNGYSDIVFRDANGNLAIQFGPNLTVDSASFPASSLGYSSTAYYNSQWGQTTGKFDQAWTVAGVGDFEGNGYAAILWVNTTTGQVGVTNFAAGDPSKAFGTVFAQLAGQQIAALGDFNGDGTTDMLLSSTTSTQLAIWYSCYNNGALYKAGPTFPTNGLPFPSPGYVPQP